MKKGGQIWVETVIYTLIAFVMIGLVLAYVKPKIEELRDKTLIEQSIAMMKDIDLTILTMGGSGNRRIVEMKIKEGNLEIDGINDRLIFEIESKYTYSEPGLDVMDGGVLIHTEKIGKINLVDLTQDYVTEYNITYSGKDDIKTISKSPLAYTFLISNKGEGKFNTSQSCIESSDCNDIIGYSKQCDNTDLICRYRADRVTIDFSIIK